MCTCRYFLDLQEKKSYLAYEIIFFKSCSLLVLSCFILHSFGNGNQITQFTFIHFNSVLKLSVLWDMVLLIEPDGGGGTTTLLAILSFYARCNFCL